MDEFARNPQKPGHKVLIVCHSYPELDEHNHVEPVPTLRIPSIPAVVSSEGHQVRRLAQVIMTNKKRERIFLSPPHMSGLERQFVHEAFESNWIAPLDPQVGAFEREFAEYAGIKHCGGAIR